MAIELCACGHANDHLGKPCGHDAIAAEGRCACHYGQRVDLATFRVVVEQNEILSQIGMTMMRLLATVERAAGLESGLQLDEDKKHLRAVVREVQKTARLFVPR